MKPHHLVGLGALALMVLWTLTAPGWFASGRIGRALTDLDIWAQIHIPYPVLTLLLIGVAGCAILVWARRAAVSTEDHPEIWSHRR